MSADPADQFRHIAEIWETVPQRVGDRPGATYLGRTRSYNELYSTTRRISAAYAQRFGLRRGDLIAAAMPNCIEFYLAYWAAVRSGIVVVPINTRLLPRDMLAVAQDVGAKLLLTHEDIWPGLEGLELPTPTVGVEVEAEGVVPFGELAEFDGDADACPDIEPDDLMLIMHTSGTTGRPKGALITHANLLFNIRVARDGHELTGDDVHLLVAPMFHCTALYTMLPSSAWLGAQIVIAPAPDLNDIVDLIETQRCTTVFSVPTMFHFMASRPDITERDLKSLRLLGYAGAPMPTGTIKKLRATFPGVKLHNFFGLTETIAMTHVLPDADADTRPDSIGLPLPGIQQRIVREDGTDAGPGEIGELCLGRGNVVGDYWNRPGLMAKSIQGEWFHTGDLALADENGYVYLKGRKKDMIIVGGENVYALEVESVIRKMDGVADVAVVGAPATGLREAMGELVRAVVVPEADAALTELDVKRFCNGKLAGYAVPQLVEFRDALPRNPAGKVVKHEL
jgi:acyl-CoA synthetase (AMP-forming)/AMP-acid ligase II